MDNTPSHLNLPQRIHEQPQEKLVYVKIPSLKEQVEAWLNENIEGLKNSGDFQEGKFNGNLVKIDKCSHLIRMYPMDVTVDIGNGCGCSVELDFRTF